MRKLLPLLTLLLFTFLLNAQNNSTPHRLKVFIDCSNTWCDQTFIKTEINIVDYLLDNQAADVHVLITEQGTGSSSQFQLIFFGQNQFKNQMDTIRFNTIPNSTDFERRDLFIKYLKLGLAPFIAKTSSASGVTINMKQENTGDEKKLAAPTKDPWNYWVFRINANGNINADAVYKNLRYNSRFSASRVTDDIKINFGINGSKDKTTYEIDDGLGGVEKFIVDNNYYGFNHSLIKSINSHWSYGYEVNVNSSTFSNNRRTSSFRTGIEYDIFPYKDVNNKYLTISYTADIRHNKYYDTTLYDKTKETLLGHGVEMNLSMNQKWGNVNVGFSYHNYLHNWKYYNIGLNMFIYVRITGGLTFNVGAFGGLTRDQIYLLKEGATEQEVLTRRRQIASGYNYYTSFGLSYRFGSKLSNFVNPRFEGGGNYY